MPTILFAGMPFGPEGDAEEAKFFGPDVTLDYARVDSPDAIAPERWAAADVVMLFRFFLPAERIAQLTRCRLLVRYGVGVDRVDRKALAARQIALANTPDYGTTEVADHAVAMILALRRGLAAYDGGLRNNLRGNWRFEHAGGIRRMGAQRAAIVGLGRIGTAVALRLKAFGTQVVFYDPYLPQGTDRALGLLRAATLEAVLEGADILSLHAPLTQATMGMIGAAELARLAPGAVVVNTARGKIMDHDALHDALASGHIAAAGLDALPTEPPDPAREKLFAAWQSGALDGRLMVTPHAAFHSPEAQADLRRLGAETAREFLRHGTVRTPYPEDAF